MGNHSEEIPRICTIATVNRNSYTRGIVVRLWEAQSGGKHKPLLSVLNFYIFQTDPNDLEHMGPRSGQSGIHIRNRILEVGDIEELEPRY